MPEVVHAWPRVITRSPQTDLTRQPPDNWMNVLMKQWFASLRNEKIRGAARRHVGVAELRVVA